MRWLVLFALAATMIPTWRYFRDRARRQQRNVFSRWPIRRVAIGEIDAVFQRGALGPTHDTEVHFLGGIEVLPIVGGTTDLEAWILAVLSKRAHLMFEFGTATGRTAYLWARNSPADAQIVTLTLSSDNTSAYRREAGDAEEDVRNALEESKISTFYYTNTSVASKVVQLYGDSKTIDVRPWEEQCDIVFVDGSHARSHVQSDSRNAMRLVRPGGLVLWHDYRGPEVPGVYETLNELSREIPLVHIARTSLVAYRRPPSSSENEGGHAALGE